MECLLFSFVSRRVSEAGNHLVDDEAGLCIDLCAVTVGAGLSVASKSPAGRSYQVSICRTVASS